MKWPCLLALAALILWPLPARTEHARIDLRAIRLDVKAGQSPNEASASADTEPPLGGLQLRPLFQAKAGEPLALQFVLTNTYPHGVKKDVTVRFFVAREDRPRQKTLPDLGKGVVTQGQFTLDFKPGCRVGARVRFTIRQPGVYLLRVETLNTDSDHEHFSAIDLQVK
jgi:hypothetical protein